MKLRHLGVIITYILLYFSNYALEPLFMNVFHFTVGESNAYGRVLGYAIACIIIVLLMKKDLKKTDTASPRGTAIKWFALGIPIYFIALLLYVGVSVIIFNIEPGSSHSDTIKNKVLSYPLTVLNVIFFAPILEEIVTKKIILDTLRKHVNVYVSCLLTSLLFASLHMELSSMIPYTLTGLVFSFLYVKTGRLMVPILVHMTINALSVFMG